MGWGIDARENSIFASAANLECSVPRIYWAREVANSFATKNFYILLVAANAMNMKVVSYVTMKKTDKKHVHQIQL